MSSAQQRVESRDVGHGDTRQSQVVEVRKRISPGCEPLLNSLARAVAQTDCMSRLPRLMLSRPVSRTMQCRRRLAATPSGTDQGEESGKVFGLTPMMLDAGLGQGCVPVRSRPGQPGSGRLRTTSASANVRRSVRSRSSRPGPSNRARRGAGPRGPRSHGGAGPRRLSSAPGCSDRSRASLDHR